MIGELYSPPEAQNWKGRSDGKNAMRWHEVISLLDLRQQGSVSGRGFALLGFACDEGIRRNYGREGAKEGPTAIRRALASLPWHGSKALYDAGDIVCHRGELEEAQQALAHAVQIIIDRGLHPMLLGGGHEIAWGHYQGLQQAFQKQNIAIINFDAHFDMRPLLEGDRGSSGTSFLQMYNYCQKEKLKFDYTCLGIQPGSNTTALFEIAREAKVKVIEAEEFFVKEAEIGLEVAKEVVKHHDRIYLTICLDVFAAPFAPGVSAPQPLGIFPWHVIPALRYLAASGKVVGFDVAELSPPLDNDERTAKLAAQLIAEYCCSGSKGVND